MQSSTICLNGQLFHYQHHQMQVDYECIGNNSQTLIIDSAYPTNGNCTVPVSSVSKGLYYLKIKQWLVIGNSIIIEHVVIVYTLWIHTDIITVKYSNTHAVCLSILATGRLSHDFQSILSLYLYLLYWIRIKTRWHFCRNCNFDAPPSKWWCMVYM